MFVAGWTADGDDPWPCPPSSASSEDAPGHVVHLSQKRRSASKALIRELLSSHTTTTGGLTACKKILWVG